MLRAAAVAAGLLLLLEAAAYSAPGPAQQLDELDQVGPVLPPGSMAGAILLPRSRRACGSAEIARGRTIRALSFRGGGW